VPGHGLGLHLLAFVGVRLPREDFQRETQPVRTVAAKAWAWIRGR
jgi:hypothetical protein